MEVKKIMEKVKAKIKETKEKAKAKVQAAKKDVFEFVLANPGVCVPVASGIGMLFIGASRIAKSKIEACKVADNNWTGCSYMATHPLTNDEIRELDQRMGHGQTKGDALAEMGVLKEENRRKN